MADLLGRLNKRQTNPLPTISETINRPQATLRSTATRVGTLPRAGALATAQGSKKRFVSDLPAKVQLEGIQQILGGQDSRSSVINNFVRQMSAQGKSPEEIRVAFIEQQKRSKNPLSIA